MAHKIVITAMLTCFILMLMVIVEASSFSIAPTTASVGYKEEGSIPGVPIEGPVPPPVGSSIPSPPPLPYSSPLGELEKGSLADGVPVEGPVSPPLGSSTPPPEGSSTPPPEGS